MPAHDRSKVELMRSLNEGIALAADSLASTRSSNGSVTSTASEML